MNGTTFNASQVANIVAVAVAAALNEALPGENVRISPQSIKAVTKAPAKRVRAADPNSAMSKARTLYDEMKSADNSATTATRKRIIKAFSRKLRLNPNVANTYYHKILREKQAASSLPARKRTH